jgi:predicted deacylase
VAALADFIPPDYLTARQQFRAAMQLRNVAAESHSVSSTDDLTIDVARVGPADAERLVIVSSGLHGAEGPFGSGVQLAMLAESWPSAVPILFIHALNPFGYHHQRRADADNIDLNRNFLKPGEEYRGVQPYHDLVDPIINPTRPPRLDFWLLRLYLLQLRLGHKALRQAVAGGQYENPSGLFFGGHRPSVTMRILENNMARWIGSAKTVIHLDFHTGLGAKGTHKLLVSCPPNSEQFARWTARFGAVVESCGGPTAYLNRGGIDDWMMERFAHIEVDSVCAEFGTYPVVPVLKAVRYENLAYHYTQPGSRHRTKAANLVREAFVPADRAWRETVVRDGVALIRRAAEVLAQ